MEPKIRRLSSRNLMILLVFVIFITLRLFVNFHDYFIGGDDAKYLTLARHFPYHTLDNKNLFLLHGPIYPYLIHFLSFFFEDYKAGILLSLFSYVVTFFVLYKLLLLLSKNYTTTITVMILYSLSVENIHFATIIQKEAFMLMLFLLSIYFYTKGMLVTKKSMPIASFFAAITALTTDHVIFLIASFVAAYLIFGNNATKKKTAFLPILITILFYSIILLARIYVYTHNQYYSTGVDGVVEQVSDFGVRQVFAPAFFPETMKIVFFKSSLIINILFIFGYLFNVVPFGIPPALDRHSIRILFFDNFTFLITSIKLLVYILLFSLFVYGVYHFFKELSYKKLKNNYNLFLFFMFIFFISPVTQRITTIRMVLTASIPLFYFIAFGFTKVNLAKNLKKYFSVLAISILLITPLYWVRDHNSFVLSVGKSIEASNTAAFLNSLPEEGIMSQVGYSPELNYQTEKRIISMPSEPENLNRILKYFRINYVLYGERYWEKFSDNNKDRVFNYDTIKYIRENPQKFQLLNIIKEDYGNLSLPDNIYVYEFIE